MKLTPQDYYRIASSLFASKQEGNWMRCVRHVVPRLITVSALTELPDDGLPARICARAASAVRKYAAAHISYITPRGVNWFSLSSDRQDLSIDDRDWYARATQVMQREIEKSNFYSALIYATIDHVAAGTGATLIEGYEHGLIFTHIPMGTYAMAENDDHKIDTFVREFHLTPHQLAQKFGYEHLSHTIQLAYDDPARRHSDQIRIWHLTIPRDVPHHGNTERLADPRTMPFASVYIDPSDQFILSESGYGEFPYFVTRFRKYGNQVFGESALAPVVDLIEDCLCNDEAIKTIAQLQAFPRVIAPANMVDEIDLRSGGITIVSPENLASEYPKEWASSGDARALLDQRDKIHEEIDSALLVDQLQAVSQVDREMSATEAQIREREKLMTFAETFTQYSADLSPALDRVFCILLRMGKFPEEGVPSKDFLQPVGNNSFRVIAPGVSYIGRLAKALEGTKQQGLMDALAYAAQMFSATQDPAWMDLFSPPDCMRFITDASNVPTECLLPPRQARALAQQRQQAAMAAQAAAMSQQFASAENNLASAQAK